jgi:hypothetical protein
MSGNATTKKRLLTPPADLSQECRPMAASIHAENEWAFFAI